MGGEVASGEIREHFGIKSINPRRVRPPRMKKESEIKRIRKKGLEIKRIKNRKRIRIEKKLARCCVLMLMSFCHIMIIFCLH